LLFLFINFTKHSSIDRPFFDVDELLAKRAEWGNLSLTTLSKRRPFKNTSWEDSTKNNSFIQSQTEKMQCRRIQYVSPIRTFQMLPPSPQGVCAKDSLRQMKIKQNSIFSIFIENKMHQASWSSRLETLR